jgi:hypothetical protein
MSLGLHMRQIRHAFLPTDEERDADQLASAADLHDLEACIRELDRSKRQRRGPFHPF